nr:SAM-dependent methyltransferase [Rhodocyclaceae bacterium]
LKWRQSPEGVAELARKQHDILQGAARLVKPGGRLVYATCSILSEENEAIVAAFLAAHPEFRQVSAQAILEKQGAALACGETLRLAPHTHGTDGFFAAILERIP